MLDVEQLRLKFGIFLAREVKLTVLLFDSSKASVQRCTEVRRVSPQRRLRAKVFLAKRGKRGLHEPHRLSGLQERLFELARR